VDRLTGALMFPTYLVVSALEAIALYLEVLKEDGQPIPEPSTQVGKVAVTI
jgi:predicted RNase H-like HicB family nuclease